MQISSVKHLSPLSFIIITVSTKVFQTSFSACIPFLQIRVVSKTYHLCHHSPSPGCLFASKGKSSCRIFNVMFPWWFAQRCASSNNNNGAFRITPANRVRTEETPLMSQASYPFTTGYYQSWCFYCYNKALSYPKQKPEQNGYPFLQPSISELKQRNVIQLHYSLTHY